MRRALVAVLALGLVALALVAGLGETDRRPAPAHVVRDCRAALRLVVTDAGKIPSKPQACEPLTPGQYRTAVSDVTRKYRITPTS